MNRLLLNLRREVEAEAAALMLLKVVLERERLLVGDLHGHHLRKRGRLREQIEVAERECSLYWLRARNRYGVSGLLLVAAAPVARLHNHVPKADVPLDGKLQRILGAMHVDGVTELL